MAQCCDAGCANAVPEGVHGVYLRRALGSQAEPQLLPGLVLSAFEAEPACRCQDDALCCLGHGCLQKTPDLTALELQFLLEREIEIHTAAAESEMGAGGSFLPSCLLQDLHQGPLRFSAALFGHAQTDPLPRQDIFDDADALRCLHDSLARVIDPGYITFQYVAFFH